MRGDFDKKPDGVYYAREIAEMLDVPLYHIQVLAQVMKVKKDAANLLCFTEKQVIKIKEFMKNE